MLSFLLSVSLNNCFHIKKKKKVALEVEENLKGKGLNLHVEVVAAASLF